MSVKSLVVYERQDSVLETTWKGIPKASTLQPFRRMNLPRSSGVMFQDVNQRTKRGHVLTILGVI